MSKFLQLFKPRRIGTQIAVLVVTSLLLAQTITAATVFLLSASPPNFINSPGAAIARLVFFARMLDAAPNPESRSIIVDAARNSFPDLSVHISGQLPDGLVSDSRFFAGAQAELGDRFTVFTIRAQDDPFRDALQMGIQLPDGSVITGPVSPPRWRPGPSPLLISGLVFLASAIALLTLWGSRTLTAPLIEFADAAERFTVGRMDAPLSEQGPLEIRRAARALNEMRARIQQMVEDRTRMLAAVGHDLRTPITRLRLRAEEIEPESLKRPVIRDLDVMRDMVHSALSFLRDQAAAGRHVSTDLPSLIQTVCDGFCDMGRDVKFVGPSHLRIRCDPDQLTRALVNLIDNGVKFGTAVTVALDHPQNGSVTVEVRDDGPGIADHEKVLAMQPFYRGDAARGSDGHGSCGLGLAIARAAAESHGGTIELLDGAPKGLIARMTLAGE